MMLFVFAQEQPHGQKSPGSVESPVEKAEHGGTNIAPDPYTAAVPVEKVGSALPGVQTEGGTSRCTCLPNFCRPFQSES
jgi:hypothetical protein